MFICQAIKRWKNDKLLICQHYFCLILQLSCCICPYLKLKLVILLIWYQNPDNQVSMLFWGPILDKDFFAVENWYMGSNKGSIWAVWFKESKFRDHSKWDKEVEWWVGILLHQVWVILLIFYRTKTSKKNFLFLMYKSKWSLLSNPTSPHFL